MRSKTGAQGMSSVHAGLSGSLTMAEVFFGDLEVVAGLFAGEPKLADANW